MVKQYGGDEDATVADMHPSFTLIKSEDARGKRREARSQRQEARSQRGGKRNFLATSVVQAMLLYLEFLIPDS